MLKCPNCSQESERTEDWACQWCGYPLVAKEYGWEAIVYLLAIALAEAATVLYVPLVGIVGHIVIMVALILHAALATKYHYRELLLSLALVPLVRIMSLSMPLANIPQIWWYPIIYIPLLAAAIVVFRLTGYKAQDVGLTFRLLRVQLVVGLTGVLFGVAEYFILTPQPMVAEFAWQTIWLPASILLVCTGFTEEFIFRGVLQRAAVERLRGWGIVYISLLFATLHIGFLSWIDVAFVFVVALFFGWMVEKTGSLLGVSLSHGITNILLYLVVPFFL